MAFTTFNLDDILEQPTQYRSEASSQPQEITDFSGLEFEDDIDNVEELASSEAIEIELPYSPEDNAETLVELINLGNIGLLTPLATWKIRRKRIGNKEALRKKQLLFEKNFNKEELTEEEKRSLELYQAYLRDKEQIEEAIPYSDDEKEALKNAAIPYFRKNKIRIEGGAAFWTQLAFIQGQRFVQIFTA